VLNEISCQRQKYAISSRLLDATLRKRYTEGWDGQTDTTRLFTLTSCRVYFEMTFTENTSELEEHDLAPLWKILNIPLHAVISC